MSEWATFGGVQGLTEAVTHYTSGPDVALVSGTVFGIVSTDDVIYRAMLVRTEPGADTIGDCFARLREAPPRNGEFAIARADKTTIALVLSARGRAEVTLSSGRAVLVCHPDDIEQGEGEYGFDDVAGVMLWIAASTASDDVPIDNPDDEVFTVREGVVSADQLRRRTGRFAQLPTETVDEIGNETRRRETVHVDTVRVEDGIERVLAIPCPEGHLNPTHAMQCRVCELPVETTVPRLVARQPLGTLAFSDGTRVLLDGDFVIGRDPTASADDRDAALLKFESAGTGLSRTHATITVTGWQVFIVDRWSTNGTEVALRGHPARRLHSDEPTAVMPGTRIDFGGALWCVIEVAS